MACDFEVVVRRTIQWFIVLHVSRLSLHRRSASYLCACLVVDAKRSQLRTEQRENEAQAEADMVRDQIQRLHGFLSDLQGVPDLVQRAQGQLHAIRSFDFDAIIVPDATSLDKNNASTTTAAFAALHRDDLELERSERASKLLEEVREVQTRVVDYAQHVWQCCTDALTTFGAVPEDTVAAPADGGDGVSDAHQRPDTEQLRAYLADSQAELRRDSRSKRLPAPRLESQPGTERVLDLLESMARHFEAYLVYHGQSIQQSNLPVKVVAADYEAFRVDTNGMLFQSTCSLWLVSTVRAQGHWSTWPEMMSHTLVLFYTARVGVI